MPTWLSFLLGGIFALAATVLLYIFVFPERRKNRLNKFFATIKKLLSTDYLLIEKIAKFIYVLSTMSCIFSGFWMLFSVERYYSSYYSYELRRYVDYTQTRYTGWVGILVILLGPIACRLTYELFMMFVMLVKNTIDIRKHLTKDEGAANPFADTATPDLSSILKARKAAVTLEKAPAPAEAEEVQEVEETDEPEQ